MKFIEIPKAAALAHMSERHFRRVMVRDRIPVVKIHEPRRKHLILVRDFEVWAAAHVGR